jgi:hypothetical protein
VVPLREGSGVLTVAAVETESLWHVALAALGGSFVGGVFILIGGWLERNAAREARSEERAAVRQGAHADSQRAASRRLQEVLLEVAVAFSELAALASRFRLSPGVAGVT